MDGKDGIGSETLPKKGRGARKSNVLVFAFFLFLSFIFWYLNSLGKELETDIRYPVTLTNIPKNRTLAGDNSSRINLIVKGSGYSILKLKVSGKGSPLKIDLSKVGYRRAGNSKSFDYYIVTAGLMPSFNTQFKSTCKVTSVKPDTLFFSFNQNTR